MNFDRLKFINMKVLYFAMAETIIDNSNGRPKLISSGGIQLIKGGISIDASFLDSVVAAYANLVNRPLVLMLGALLAFVYVAEETQKDGPLEVLSVMLADIQAGSNITWERTLCAQAVKFVNMLVTYKFQLITVGFAILPYLAKPSSNSMYISAVHVVFIFLMRSWSSMTFIVLSQAHFLFASLRKPCHKLFIIIATIILLFVQFEVSATPVKREWRTAPEERGSRSSVPPAPPAEEAATRPPIIIRKKEKGI